MAFIRYKTHTKNINETYLKHNNFITMFDHNKTDFIDIIQNY